MAKVDSKGRIVLPKDVREALGIGPGTEVEVHEENGKAVIEPEDDPAQIIDRMEQLVETASAQSGETKAIDDGVPPVAAKHRDAVRSGADRDE